jgi:hypothetical protein
LEPHVLKWYKLHFKLNGGYCNIGSFLCVFTPWSNPMKVHKPYSQVYPMNVKAFLPRLIGYYKNFIKHYGNIIKSLFELRKKDVIFNWNLHCQVAFNRLKQHLFEALVLIILDFTNTFILNVKWLVKGVGPILSHKNDKHEHIICCLCKL